MSETNFAPPETNRTDVQMGLVVEDQRSGDLRRVVYADSRVVLVRDESGHTTLTPRDTFESHLGSRFRARPDADPAIDGGQYERLRDCLAEYERTDGRKARHKADALREALDLFVERPAGADGGDSTDGADGPDSGSESVAFEEIAGIGPETAGKLRRSGFETEADIRTASDDELLDVPGVGPESLEHIREYVE